MLHKPAMQSETISEHLKRFPKQKFNKFAPTQKSPEDGYV